MISLEPFQINPGLDYAVRHQQHAIFAVPPDVLEHDDFFNHVFDRNQVRKRLDLFNDCVRLLLVKAIALSLREFNAYPDAYREND